MEHILISPGKIKLIMTKTELDKYELDCNTMDSEDSTAKAAFRELLRDVGRATGFEAEDDKLFVQLYPSKDGGAEMYITKLSVRDGRNGKNMPVKRITVCRFADMAALLEGCRRLAGTPYENSAWRDDKAYYLIAEENVPYRRSFTKTEPSRVARRIGSAGESFDGKVAAAFVREHGICFCDTDAAATLAPLI